MLSIKITIKNTVCELKSNLMIIDKKKTFELLTIRTN